MKRAEIIAAVVERLETILTTNGYATSIGANVRVWHPRNLPVEPGFFGVLVSDPREELERPDGETYLHKLTIEFIVVNTVTSPDLMVGLCRLALADLARALLLTRLTLGGVPVDYLELDLDSGGNLELNQLETLGATAELTATVTYRTKREEW